MLEAAIERAGASARTMSALAMPQVCETYERQRALRHLDENRVVVFAGGTGNPFFTTDTTAVLRAAEMRCDAVLKATNVDGVYTADPKKDPTAKRYERLDPPRGLHAGPEGHGRHRVCACPRKPYAYHRVLDPRAGRDHGGAGRSRAGDHRRSMIVGVSRVRRAPVSGPRPECEQEQPRRRLSASADSRETRHGTATYDLNEIKRRMHGAIQVLKQELGGLRTGRASANLLEPVQVEAYGTHMPLNQLATVSVPEPRLLSVQVWDRSMVHAVEKAIINSNLGLSPSTEGQVLRLRIPELNQERRKEMVKVAHKYAEAARVAVRHVRRDALDLLKKLEKDGKVSEDDHERMAAEVQKATDQVIAEVDQSLAAKEKEIMTV